MSEEPAATCVLDASALLAWLHCEPGATAVERVLNGALISSVNWSEVVQKSLARGVDVAGLREDLCALGLRVVPFTPDDAEIAALLWPKTKAIGLSLGDRACLALGLRAHLHVLTADRSWQSLALGVEVRAVR